MTPAASPPEAVCEAWAVPEVQQLAQPFVLADGEQALVDLLTKQLVLVAQALGVRARVEEAVDPCVCVPERLGDTVGCHLERAQHRRGARLDARDGAVVVLPEGERHERERDQHEAADDEPPPRCGGGSRGRLACGRAPDGHAQHRRARGAVPWHRRIVAAAQAASGGLS